MTDDVLKKFVNFATRMAPAQDQKPFRADLEQWISSSTEEDRAKLAHQLRNGKSINRAMLPPSLRSATNGLSKNCIPIARSLLTAFNAKLEGGSPSTDG